MEMDIEIPSQRYDSGYGIDAKTGTLRTSQTSFFSFLKTLFKRLICTGVTYHDVSIGTKRDEQGRDKRFVLRNIINTRFHSLPERQ